MASMILNPADIDVKKIEFGPVKLLESGGKSVNVRYEGRNLMIETPSLSLPFGVNVFDKQGPPKYSVDLSFRGADDNTAIRQLQDFFEAFDERMIDAGVENASKWHKMANPNRDVIKAFYTPTVKLSRDAQGVPKPYPPTFKLALRKRKAPSTAFETDFYDGTQKPLAQYAADTPIDQILPKRSQITAIVQCTGVWFAGGKFGTTWKAVQMRVDSQPEQLRGAAFRSEAPDIRAFVAKNIAKAVEDAASEDAGSDVEAEEVVAAVMPAPKKVATLPVSKPTSTPVAAFQEEQVSEPVPVPKKVVKKIVAKK
jgi:hypothetical protein